ncbi:hypothetical protein [Bradyrhizobium genosp. A]|uniref:hypothetical protein n=1 Tax=Bradyrhizobium genosp. A TaxID=83626 RepID=UPI003CF864C2
MSNGNLFDKLKSKEYEERLDKNLVELLSKYAPDDIVPLSVLGFPRFFFRDTYSQLCKRHNIESSSIESFFQSYDRDEELYIPEPIRKVLRNFFARKLDASVQSEDFRFVLSSFAKRAETEDHDARSKYQIEIIYLEYFLRPSWALSQYVNVYTLAARHSTILPSLRRLVRGLDDFRKDDLFGSERDLAVHQAIRSTTDPWRPGLSDRITAISAVLEKLSPEPFHLHLSEELLKALIKKRDIDECLRVAAQLEKTAQTANRFDWQALAVRYQARANLLKDDYQACEQLLKKARDIIVAHDPGNEAGEIKVQEISADMFRLIFEFDKADEAINSCISYYKEHEYLYEYANAVFKRAKILSERNDSDSQSIIDQLRSVEPIFEKMGDPTGRGNLRNFYVSCLLSQSDFDDEEVTRLLDAAQFDHQRGHSESGAANSLILRAKREWRRETNDFDKGLGYASDAISKILKIGGTDIHGLFYAHDIKAKLLLKAARFEDLAQEMRELEALNLRLSKNSGDNQIASENRSRQIAELEAGARPVSSM